MAFDQHGLGPPEAAPNPDLWPWISEWRIPAEINPPHRTTPNRFPGFLTRVCNDCEDMILSEIFLRTDQNGPPAVRAQIPPNAGEIESWEDYPAVSCVCKSKLGIEGGQRTLCYRHVDQLWRQMQRTKDGNDRWLFRIQKRGGVLQRATPATMRKRVYWTPQVPPPWPQGATIGFYRACRVSRKTTFERPCLLSFSAGMRSDRLVLLECIFAWYDQFECLIALANLKQACEGWVSRCPPLANPPVHSLAVVNRARRQFAGRYQLQRQLPGL